MRQQITRRQALLGTGTLATGLIGSTVLYSNNVEATVSGDFEIPDGEAILADEDIQDVRLSVDATYEYVSNGDLHGIELELHVGSMPDTVDMIARHTRGDLGTDELTGEETLNGSVMSASDFSISDFETSNGELRRTIVAQLRFYAIRNDEVVAEAIQTETFDVVIRNEELTVDMTLGGTGTVSFETS